MEVDREIALAKIDLATRLYAEASARAGNDPALRQLLMNVAEQGAAKIRRI